MSKIKNMGTATMRFGEGAIVSGSAAHPDGTISTNTLIVSGTIKNEGSITTDSIDTDSITLTGASTSDIKQAGNLDCYIRFRRTNDYPGMIFVNGGFNMMEFWQDYDGQVNSGPTQGAVVINQDGLEVDFRVETNNKSNAIYVDATNDVVYLGGYRASSPAGTDVVLYVSGTTPSDGGGKGTASGATVINSDLVVSGTYRGGYDPNAGSESFQVLSDNFFLLSNPADFGGSQIEALDSNFFVTGSIGSRGGDTPGTAVFGGDVVTSGSLSVGAITIPNTDGTNGQVLKTDGSGSLTWQDLTWQDGSASGSASAAGSNTQIQYNNNGALGASSDLTFTAISGQDSVLGINGTIEHDNYSKTLYPSNMTNTGSYAKQKSFVKELFYTKYDWSGTSYTDLFTMEPYDDRTGLPYTGSSIWAVVGIECTLTGHRRFVGNTFTKNYMVLDWAAGTSRSYGEYTGVRIGADPSVWFDADTSVSTNGIKLRFRYNNSSVGNANLHFVINAGYPIDDLSAGSDGKHIYWVLTEHFSEPSE